MTPQDDWLLTFLSDFAAMSEGERDAAIDALPPERREALVALADVRADAGAVDLMAVLDAGHLGLEQLYEVADPVDLYAVLSLAARDRAQILVEALFAALVAHRGWEHGEPDDIADLRDRWVWHVHEQVTRERDPGQSGPGSGVG
jgi:hypothetical protein